jgi:hypothetical protein
MLEEPDAHNEALAEEPALMQPPIQERDGDKDEESQRDQGMIAGICGEPSLPIRYHAHLRSGASLEDIGGFER